MFNYGQVNPPRPRRQFQDQGSPRNSQRSQDARSAQQRLRHTRHPDNRLETAGSGRHALPFQWQIQPRAIPLGSRGGRGTSFSADRSTEGGERLSQKKITDELIGDRRQLIEPTHPHLSVSRQCEVLGLARSSYYYQPVGESAENLALMNRIDRIFTDRPELGARRMHQELTSPDRPLNVKRIRRLMRLMGLEAVYPKPNLSKAAPGHQIYPYLLRGVPVEDRNHVWSTDITYIPMANGFLYLCAVIDWHSRFVLSWRLSNTLLVDFCIEALEEALGRWGKPQIFNTDQGSQFTSPRFLDPLKSAEVRISMDSKGRALDNIFVERLWRTVKYEHVYLHAYRDGLSLYRGLRQYFHFYNYGRKHQSLGYQTPAQWYVGMEGKGNSTISESNDHILI